PSTTKYSVVMNGKYMYFEGKQTQNHTSFPLHNFHEHQISHMQQVVAQGGICFVILRFAKEEEIFLLESRHLFFYWDRMLAGGRKSIKKEEIEENGHPIPVGYRPRIDYIAVLKQLYAL
ncbi:MAG: Holliday junction resolvase RecU, partial [Bacillus sp. (in: Bacteria)]|nr:Holliday junction resolvase RecU [Bacillus sp. (in: firmicutes)]